MPESDSPLILILLWTVLGLLVLLSLATWGVSRRLARVERRLMERATFSGSEAQLSPSMAETTAGGAFETFLNEDPARRSLPKGEQFAAYRRWRQEKGLNWSGS